MNNRKIVQKVNKSRQCTKLTTNTVAKSCKSKSTERSVTNPCLGRSYNKLSTSLEHLGQHKYEAQGHMAKVPKSCVRHSEKTIKTCTSTPDLTISNTKNWRYWMMEKTVPRTEHIKKYQKYRVHTEEERQRESAEKENSDAIVRRRPRKTIQKIRPKSEVREKEVLIGQERRRPLSYIDGFFRSSPFCIFFF